MDQRNCEVLTMDIEWPYACVYIRISVVDYGLKF